MEISPPAVEASGRITLPPSATYVAALKLRDKALDMAAQLMQSAPGDLDIVDGMVVRKAGGPSMPLGAVATALLPASPVRHGREPGLRADGWFHVAHQVYPYGSHLAVVKVDPDTGAVAIERYVIGYDVGHQSHAGRGPDRRRLRPRRRRRPHG